MDAWPPRLTTETLCWDGWAAGRLATERFPGSSFTAQTSSLSGDVARGCSEDAAGARGPTTDATPNALLRVGLASGSGGRSALGGCRAGEVGTVAALGEALRGSRLVASTGPP